MPIKSRWSVDVPVCDLSTWVFGAPQAQLPEVPNYIDAHRPWTHALSSSSLREWAQRLAVGLQKAGLKQGDRVLLFSGNNLFYPVVFMGVIMAGGVFSGANPNYVPRELAYQLKDSAATFLLCTDQNIRAGKEAAQEAGLDKDHVFVFDDRAMDGDGKSLEGFKNWTTLLAPVSEGRKFQWEVLSTREQTARAVVLNYSSGTTGLPKGVEVSHYAYVANGVQFSHLQSLKKDFKQYKQREKQLCFLPLYHAMSQTIYISVMAKDRVPTYIMKKYNFEEMLRNIQTFGITHLQLVPPVLVSIAKSPLTKKYDLSTIERVNCGAAPLGREMCEEFEKLWPKNQVNVKQGWGMTEAVCSILGWNPNEESLSFSVGEPNANCEIKIVSTEDSKTEITDPETRGELWVRGPNIMSGYWNKPEATKETLVDGGWLRTGDICYVDNDKKVYIVDRMKELIKVRGNQVAPAELEGLLLSHPDIDDAAVIGVKLDGEEVPRAYLVKNENGKAKSEDIQSWMKERVSKTKYLDGGVVFMDAIPKNPSGKILRKELRATAEKELQGPKAKL